MPTAAPARGDRIALARLLNQLEAALPTPERVAWLDALWPAATEATVGITGPPGAGKSTLIGRLVAAWRATGLTVGVLCVDPSSRETGGALLGDRVRLGLAGDDAGIFVRSLAARGLLGGLAPATFDMALALAATHDRVIVETVGVGQSEIAIADVADLVAVVLQPGSGDALQYIKAGLMEVPDLLVVNKSDLGPLAAQTQRDARHALTARGKRETPIVAVSAQSGDGIANLVRTLDDLLRAHPHTYPSRARDTLRADLVGRFEAWFGLREIAMAGGREALTARLATLPEDAGPAQIWAALEHALPSHHGR